MWKLIFNKVNKKWKVEVTKSKNKIANIKKKSKNLNGSFRNKFNKLVVVQREILFIKIKLQT